MSPVRIQRRRTAGWRAPEGSIYVGRGTPFGNPFTVEDALREGFADNEDDARRACVEAHRDWLDGDPAYRDTYTIGRRAYDRREVHTKLHELAGRDLTCWCPEPTRGRADYCHAATLIVLAGAAHPEVR